MRSQDANCCHLCPSAAGEATSDGRLRVCRRCYRDKVLPLLRAALGESELRALILADDSNSPNGKPAKLMAGATKNGIPAAVPAGGTEFGAGLGRPPRRRQPTAAEVTLALRRAEARQRGQVLPRDIVSEVLKAGLRA